MKLVTLRELLNLDNATVIFVLASIANCKAEPFSRSWKRNHLLDKTLQAVK